MTPEPGGLQVTVDDERVGISMTGGGDWTLPLGPATLLAGELDGTDPPGAIELTNALAAVRDHFDDIVNAAPSVLATPSVIADGPHAVGLARVEVGAAVLPPGYELRRDDAEEVFRTLVAEPAAERRFNPGLPAEHVETIVATCCVILAIMRRLDLDRIGIGSADAGRADGAAGIAGAGA